MATSRTVGGYAYHPRHVLLALAVLLAWAVVLTDGLLQGLSYVSLIGVGVHALVYDRLASLPISCAVFGGSVLGPLAIVDERLAIVAYLALLILAVAVLWDDAGYLQVGALLAYAAGVLVHVAVLSPLNSGDTTSYFEQLAVYDTVGGYLAVFLRGAIADPIWLTDFYTKFPLVYYPFYESLGVTSPVSFVAINATLWIAAALAFHRILEAWADRVETDHARPLHVEPRTVTALLIVSPFFVYYSSQFHKELSVAALTILAAFLVVRKRLVTAGLVALLACYLRPYAAPMIGVYVLVAWDRLDLLVVTLLASLAGLLVYPGTVVALFNAVVSFGFLFVTPLPVDLGNWLRPRGTYRTLEALVVSVAFACSIPVIVLDRQRRRTYALLGVGIAVYAVVLVAVGYYTLGDPAAYGPFDLGVNAARKKSLVQPLILAWAAVTLNAVRERFPDVDLRT